MTSRGWNGWTDANFEKAKALWAEGKTATQIGAILGCTRNAVLSKIHRSGLALRPGTSKKWGERDTARAFNKPNPKPPKAKGAAQPKAQRVSATEMFGDADPYVEREDIIVPEAERKGVVDLEPDDCRWPIGDPRAADFHFCNGKKVPGLPYCEHHARRAYQPIQPRHKPSNDNAPKSPARVKEVENA